MIHTSDFVHFKWLASEIYLKCSSSSFCSASRYLDLIFYSFYFNKVFLFLWLFQTWVYFLFSLKYLLSKDKTFSEIPRFVKKNNEFFIPKVLFIFRRLLIFLFHFFLLVTSSIKYWLANSFKIYLFSEYDTCFRYHMKFNGIKWEYLFFMGFSSKDIKDESIIKTTISYKFRNQWTTFVILILVYVHSDRNIPQISTDIWARTGLLVTTKKKCKK